VSDGKLIKGGITVMDISQKSIRLIVWGTLLTVTSLVRADDSPTKDQQLVQFFQEKWKAQKSEILSAHVTCHFMRRGLEQKPNGTSITPDQLENLIRTSDFRLRPNDIYDFATKIGLTLDAEKPAWGILDITYNNGRTREQYTYDGALISDQISGGENDVRIDELNRQIDIHPSGGSRIKMTGLRGLRFIPTIAEAEPINAINRLDNGTVTISLPSKEFLVEEKTGLVRQAIEERSDGLRHEIIQSGSLNLRDIVFPDSIVEAKFLNGSLIMIGITTIDKIELNQNVEADAFQIAAKKDDRVWDYRQDRKNPEYVEVSKPVANVIGFVNDPHDSTNNELSKNSNPVRWLVAGVTVAFFMLLALSIYRKFAARSSH
jgi:hypothetical protein